MVLRKRFGKSKVPIPRIGLVKYNGLYALVVGKAKAIPRKIEKAILKNQRRLSLLNGDIEEIRLRQRDQTVNGQFGFTHIKPCLRVIRAKAL